MGKIILRTYGKIIAWLLTLIGLYTSCDTVEPAEYGTPTADFVVKGVVIDKNSREPIKGMAIINKSPYAPLGNDTARSDASGLYELKINSTGLLVDDLTVYTSDIDEENGTYLSDTIRIQSNEFEQVEKRKDWYQGKFEAKADFELSRDTPDSTHKE